MNRSLKKAARFLLPAQLFSTFQSIRSRNHQMRLLQEWGVSLATKEMVETYGLSVLHGPFRGMKYPRKSILSRNGIPLLFGTYELELHPIIEEVVARKYNCILDVGSAEGYYAVGFALRTRTLVHAFDCEPRERRYLCEMARINDASDLVRARPWCDSKMLVRLASGSRCLVFSDCEGFEIDLFSDGTLPALRNSDLIIEVHELFPATNVQETLLAKFQSSHDARVITFEQTLCGRFVPKKWEQFAREFRAHDQRWLYLTPKSSV